MAFRNKELASKAGWEDEGLHNRTTQQVRKANCYTEHHLDH